MPKYVNVRVDLVKRETEAAFLFVHDDEEYWVPKSQINNDTPEIWEGQTNIDVEIAKWLADEKGIPYE